MIWKDGNTQRHRTLIPKAVQDLWLSEVIIPACQAVFKDQPGIHEYIPRAILEIWPQLQSVTVTSKNSVAHLLRSMKSIVQSNQPPLGRFGSFFFAADAWGVKLITKQCLESKQSPELANIFAAFDELDWKYMLDWSKGEFCLYLGVSFHAVGKTPLVGMWDLETLHDSYQYICTKKGDVHHFSTFADYGGKKAAMKKERQQAVHLVSKISYNLAFELVWSPGKEDYICSNMEAVKDSDHFVDSCQCWLNLFKEGKQKSYGVRDKVRGTVSAIQDLLKVAYQKVESFKHFLMSSLWTNYDGDRNFWKQIQFYGYPLTYFLTSSHKDFKSYWTFSSYFLHNGHLTMPQSSHYCCI